MKLGFSRITEPVAHLVPVGVFSRIREVIFHQLRGHHQDMNLKVLLSNGYTFSVSPQPDISLCDPDGMFEVEVFGSDGNMDSEAIGFSGDTSGYIFAEQVCEILQKVADLPRKISKAS